MMKGFKPTTPVSSTSVAWRRDAKCRQLSASRVDELFFADGAHPDTVEHAKAYCSTCPVRVQCAAWGAAINAEFGVYGGVPSYARKSLIRLYRQAHPDVDTAALSENERFERFNTWISENPSMIGRAIDEASHSHNRAYWAKKRAQTVTVPAGDMRLNGVIKFTACDCVPDKCVQLTLF